MDLYVLKQLLLVAPMILFALTFHEVSHGLVAERFGDSTARIMGRLTLNPLAHLDPLGTILMFLTNFGWAKPVPVDPRRFANPRKDMIWVSLAGPWSNVLLASVFGIALRFVVPWALDGGYLEDGSALGIVIALMILGLQVNLGLGLFNLIPVQPLDGSKILLGLLPLNQAYRFQRMERYGMMVILGLFLVEQFLNIPTFSLILGWPIQALTRAFTGMSYGSLMRILRLVLQ